MNFNYMNIWNKKNIYGKYEWDTLFIICLLSV